MDKPSGGLGAMAPGNLFLARFVAHCESYAQDVQNAIL